MLENVFFSSSSSSFSMFFLSFLFYYNCTQAFFILHALTGKNATKKKQTNIERQEDRERYIYMNLKKK
jgi:hypothetical protein